MAKKKSALFEAMSRSKSLKPPPPMGVRRSAPTPTSPTPGTPAANAGANTGGALETPAWMKKGQTASAPPAAPPAAREVVPVVPSTPMPSADSSAVAPRSAPAARVASVENDADRQEIKVRVSYTTVAIIAFGMVATILMAVYVGKEWSNRHKAATETTEELLNGPARPSVLQPTPGGRGNTGETDAGEDRPTPQPTPNPAGPQLGGPQVAQNGDAPPKVAIVNGKVSREIGLNYIVVQSYPTEAEGQAIVDLLAKNGIAATVEKGLVGFGKYFSVVTAQGYPKGARENEELRRRLDGLSSEMGRKDRKFKAWDILTYRWR